MSQHELNRQVSKATGEDIAMIASLGFVELTPFPIEREPLTMDWDDHDLDRNVAVIPQRRRKRAA
jgi:hypothetical protein